MAGNPRVVTEDVTFLWDGATARLPRGQVIDVPAGSLLERAIGSEFLAPLGASAAQGAAPVSEATLEEAAESPAGTPEDAGEDTGQDGTPKAARGRRAAAQPAQDEPPAGKTAGGDQM